MGSIFAYKLFCIILSDGIPEIASGAPSYYIVAQQVYIIRKVRTLNRTEVAAPDIQAVLLLFNLIFIFTGNFDTCHQQIDRTRKFTCNLTLQLLTAFCTGKIQLGSSRTVYHDSVFSIIVVQSSRIENLSPQTFQIGMVNTIIVPPSQSKSTWQIDDYTAICIGHVLNERNSQLPFILELHRQRSPTGLFAIILLDIKWNDTATVSFGLQQGYPFIRNCRFPMSGNSKTYGIGLAACIVDYFRCRVQTHFYIIFI